MISSFPSHDPTGGGGWFVALQDTTDPNKIVRSRIDATAEDGTAYNETDWIVAGFTWDSAGDDEIKNYFNGVLDCPGGCSTETGITNPAVNLFIGENANGLHDFEGKVDWCIMLDRQLSANEVCELSRFGMDGTDTDQGYSCTLP